MVSLLTSSSTINSGLFVSVWRVSMVKVNAVTPQESGKEDPAANDGATSPDPLPQDALDINVEGRDLTEVDDGFGQLWCKRYWVKLPGCGKTASEVSDIWRERYGEFWPEGNTFYTPKGGLKPGATALSDLEMPGKTRLSTGIVVVEVKDTSFTFRTPAGHTFAGQITFSARDEADGPVAQVEIVMRASDPLFEIAMPINGHKQEDEFWAKTLRSLAESFGVEGKPQLDSVRLDKRRLWRNAGNITNNAYLHTVFYMATRPPRRLARLFSKGDEPV
jgi:hypothetical protein